MFWCLFITVRHQIGVVLEGGGWHLTVPPLSRTCGEPGWEGVLNHHGVHFWGVIFHLPSIYMAVPR